MLVMEIFSRMTYVFFLRKKSEAFSYMKMFVTFAKTQTGVYPKLILSDGGELDSQEMENFSSDLGIQYVTTAAKASNQNPFVERKNRSVQEAALAMLFTGVPRFFWEQAVDYAIYLQNRMVHRRLNWQTPIQRWDGHVNNSHGRYTRVFGCKAWVYNFATDKMNNKSKARVGVFLGVAKKRKGYLFYGADSKKILCSVHAEFDEGNFPLKNKALWDNPLFGGEDVGSEEVFPSFPINVSLPPLNESDSLARIPAGSSVSDNDEFKKEELVTPEVTLVDPSSGKSIDREGVSSEDETTDQSITFLEPTAPPESEIVDLTVRRSSRRANLSLVGQERLQTEINRKEQKEESTDHVWEVIKTQYSFGVAISESVQVRQAHANVDPLVKIPSTQKQAYASTEAKLWQDAEKREVQGLEENKTWVTVPIGSKKPITGRWVYDIKRNENNSVAYFKARWVAHGFKQVYGIDYDETFSATAQMKTCRILIALAVQHGHVVGHCDISNAFTHGVLEEEIFMIYPKGYEGTTGTCVKLLKSLYGLKQASRVWGLTLRKSLEGIGFVQCFSDTCVFKNKNYFALISFHVDDLIIVTETKEKRQEILKDLEKTFRLKDLGTLSMYLGFNISFPKPYNAHIDQHSYIQRMGQRFNLTGEIKTETLPMASKGRLSC
jgi:hypothetical protein